MNFVRSLIAKTGYPTMAMVGASAGAAGWTQSRFLQAQAKEEKWAEATDRAKIISLQEKQIALQEEQCRILREIADAVSLGGKANAEPPRSWWTAVSTGEREKK